MGAAPAVIGRADELSAVRAVVDAAAHGTATTLLISGEAGVGKTSLVRTVTDAVEAVWASCLPLTSLAVPLLPLRSALRPFPDAPDLGTTEAVLAFDAWLDRTADRRPIVLVVDDVQWADQSSLDVLMYVLAGRAGRRLGVLLTMRSGEESDGHGLRRWLADVRRMPRVTELVLDRLDRVGTREQLTVLLGRPPFESLVDDVYGRSRGNPYLTSLLARDLSPDATALPEHLPTELRDALARTWHGLSAPARKLTSVIAVGGRPDRTERIAEVASSVGFLDPVLPLLGEAVEAGVLRADPAGRYWFAHPLLAEALVENLLPDERRSLHAAFAEAVGGLADGLTADDKVSVADHYWRAGDVEAAYRSALAAAAAVQAGGGGAEALRLLRRALELQHSVCDPVVSRVELLHRLRDCAHGAGAETEELGAVERLLDLVDREREPLAAVPLLIRRTELRLATGVDVAGVVDGYREAERLSSPYPDSVEHAFATASLAYILAFLGDTAGIPLAREALRLARHSGSDHVLARALSATGYAGALSGASDGARSAAEEWDIAVRLADFDLIVGAAYDIANLKDHPTIADWAEPFHRAHEQLTMIGAPHSRVAEMCAWEAQGLLLAGDWRGCQAKLRVALGARPGPLGDARGRLIAALLACRQGQQHEAEAHLARAEEIFADYSAVRFMDFAGPAVELAAAAGDTDRAVAAALAGLGDAVPMNVERLLPLAARALADRAAAHRDRGIDPAATVARLHDLRTTYPRIVVEITALRSRHYQRLAHALQEMTDAETARGFGAPNQVMSWGRASEACHEAGIAWEEAYCRWREAEAALRDPLTRRRGVATLREAHQLATDLQAVPILTQLEALARGARIPLTPPADGVADDDAAIPGLTRREREILAHLVAGRTYAEIAKALVLSEKTVSVHVSNMLHKTGTANRVELTQLAHRLNEAATG